MQTKQDVSYGVVPVFKTGDYWQVLLVHQISYRGDDFWIFPKGHAEGDETPAETALRELKEETGLEEVLLGEDHFFVNYSFVHEDIKIEKTVTYYLGYCQNQHTQISQPHEIKELRWCSLTEAEKLVTHENSRQVLEEVKQALVRKNEGPAE